MSFETVYVADTETTGVSNKDKLVEIGWLEVDYDLNIVDRFETLIDPERPIHPSASAAHHLTQKDLEDAPTVEEVFDIILKGRVFKPATIIAHNSPFDYRFMPPQMNVNSHHCTLKASRRIYKDAPDHKMQTLRYYLGLEMPEGEDITAHRALADVFVLFELLKQILKDTGYSLQEFFEWIATPVKVDTINFGKHKGKKLSALPANYVDWLIKECNNLDPDLKHSLEKL